MGISSIRVGTVSYTHLDVYKRQAVITGQYLSWMRMIQREIGWILDTLQGKILLSAGWGTDMSVSYTHLDVYKRQTEGRTAEEKGS